MEINLLTKTTPTKGLIFNIQKFSLNDGPGIRTVIFFKGCPLRCKWCSNPESQSRLPEPMFDEKQNAEITVGKYWTVEQLMKIILQDQPFYEESGGGVTFSGGEVLFQAPFAIELAQAVKSAGINLACETEGYASSKVFESFMHYVDFMYYDCKQWDPTKHRKGTGGSNEIIIKNLVTAIKANINVHVRIPVIPGFNYTNDDAQYFGELFQKIGVKEVELLPFHQFGLKKYEDLHREYELKDVTQLQPADLSDYQEILTTAGIKTSINGW
ncbi:glycyl-radical enzyme activating protein [Xylocopilactobacillus apicola]|uniref:Formate acetyltransferase activating enzyme n=1 Tax=Xylocopilactobacillus apicola TaxID=2932184 RepID=A0AAU9D6K0_9LACO|nr:glycyl-radical enzyme activating protein [Xylocopilactobacillus apicola]BDR59173.1 formate acetyltransferase activating enzyme [Xylocopilactobacillus apicola]